MWFFKTVRANESQGWKSVRTASVHTPPTLQHHPYTHTHTVSFYCPSEVSDSISCLLQSAARMLMNTKHATQELCITPNVDTTAAAANFAKVCYCSLVGSWTACSSCTYLVLK